MKSFKVSLVLAGGVQLLCNNRIKFKRSGARSAEQAGSECRQIIFANFRLTRIVSSTGIRSRFLGFVFNFMIHHDPFGVEVRWVEVLDKIDESAVRLLIATVIKNR